MEKWRSCSGKQFCLEKRTLLGLDHEESLKVAVGKCLASRTLVVEKYVFLRSLDFEKSPRDPRVP